MSDEHPEGRLTALGSGSDYHAASAQTEPDPGILEWFPNPAYGAPGLRIEIKTREVTCLCPKTGQPDWLNLEIVYIPHVRCVESKSLKLYLLGYRNFGTFHEAFVDRVASDLIDLLDPEFIEVVGDFAARGGIAFKPVATYERDSDEARLSDGLGIVPPLGG